MSRPTSPSLFDAAMLLVIVGSLVALGVLFMTGVLPR